MRVLVFGAGGIVGRATVAEARGRGWQVRGLGHAEAEICDRESVAHAVADFAPALVVNCAAFTRVDACETERDTAFRVNGEGAGIVAEEADGVGARSIHLSSDYVFDGGATAPYEEDDPTGPRSAYGASKLEGERRALSAGALVVRTSWIFGRGGTNFVDTMRVRIERGEALAVVADQIGAPTYAPFLARALADLGESGVDGVVHYRNREPVTWYEFARAIARQLERSVEIRPVTSAEFPRPAPRPAYSVLDVARFEARLGRRVEEWSTGLAAHLERIEERR